MDWASRSSRFRATCETRVVFLKRWPSISLSWRPWSGHDTAASVAFCRKARWRMTALPKRAREAMSDQGKDKKPSGGNGLVITLLVLILATMGGGGYYFYDRLQAMDEHIENA